jgi:hypothetical protein
MTMRFPSVIPTMQVIGHLLFRGGQWPEPLNDKEVSHFPCTVLPKRAFTAVG